MNTIRLSSVFVIALITPFIMTYRLSSGDTPYWFFGCIFLAMLSFVLLDMLQLRQKTRELAKHILMWVVIIGVIGSAFVAAIVVRHQASPIYMIHDIILQQEAAVRFLLHGKNPYGATYFETPLAQWHYSDKEINPALYHFVMEPFYVLFAMPFYFVSTRTIGFFDGRMPLLFLFFITLIFADVLIKDKEKKLQFLALFAFNPAMLGYTLEGRSDIFVFAFLFGSFYFLFKKRFSFSSIAMALAFCIKQSVWPILPLYIGYLYFQKMSKKSFFQNILLLVLIIGVIMGPFLLWNSAAFIDSTINYLSGTTIHSYPISGYGFGSVLVQMGIIKTARDYFPFTILQIIICLPILVVLLKYLKKNLDTHKLIISYGVFLFIFWYFSRYFNNSHLGYLSMIFITAYFWPEEKKALHNEN